MKNKLLSFTLTISLFLISGCGKEKMLGNIDTAEVAIEATEVSDTTTEATTVTTTEATTEATTTEEPTTEATTEPEPEPIIICLDPGHDTDIHPRNHPQLGVNEQDLNLTIGLACRDRLEQYKGVVVYMTREDGHCPDAANKGKTCIETRTGIGTSVGCDLYVSLHCNGTTGKLGDSPEGAEVFVPNYKKYTADMKELGNIILDKLTEADLKSKGVFVRTKDEKGYYDDGSKQDWYYLISYSVEGGHPGIIIEHAYMDNKHDNAILKDEEKLKLIGTLDADAIAEYYGLELK